MDPAARPLPHRAYRFIPLLATILFGVVALVMYEFWGIVGLAAATLLLVVVIVLWVLGLRTRL